VAWLLMLHGLTVAEHQGRQQQASRNAHHEAACLHTMHTLGLCLLPCVMLSRRSGAWRLGCCWPLRAATRARWLTSPCQQMAGCWRQLQQTRKCGCGACRCGVGREARVQGSAALLAESQLRHSRRC
jgi:hypothetical protein